MHPSRRSDNLASCLEPCYEELQLSGTSPCLQIKPYSLRTTSAVPQDRGRGIAADMSVCVCRCLFASADAGGS